MANRPAGRRTGGKKMYTAKLFSTASTPVSIISMNEKSILDAKRYAISVALDFGIPGYDTICTIEIREPEKKKKGEQSP